MRFLFALFFCLLFHFGFCQEPVVLYNLGEKKNIMPLEEIEARMERMREQLAYDDHQWIVRLEDIHQEVKNDTIIRYVTVHVIERPVLEEVGNPADLLHKKIPDFAFPTLDGGILQSADLTGAVTLINFWFTRCPPCIAEMPFLNELQDDYAGRPVRFISMAPESAEQVRAFLARYDFRFRHIPGAKSFIQRFGEVYPRNILVDRRGVIRYIGGGLVSGLIEEGNEGLIDPHQVDTESLRVKIEELLQEAGQ